jgi:sigma-B regulation protein RsbQ
MVSGRPDGQPIVFMHGFGCDSSMWRFVAPRYEDAYKVVTFDHIGHGPTTVHDFDTVRYADLHGYTADVIERCQALELSDVILVGHSVSAMIGALACIQRPDLFDKLVMLGPSPRYIDDDGYVGGFSEAVFT